MGAVWLLDLPDVLDDAGLAVGVWPGWETRSRSSGGYDAVRAVFCHHTASSASPDADRSYMWDSTGGDQPIGAVYLARDGRITVGAAGATNCQGKGGPWDLSTGLIPLDTGNVYGIAIEAANAGTGEPWPAAQVDAYVIACRALCTAYGLDPARDCLSHREWCEPSCPGRKIDPAGPSPYATGSASWDMVAFRDDVIGDLEPPPEPEPEPEPPEDDDMPLTFVAAAPGLATVLVAIDGAGVSVLAFASGDDQTAILAAVGDPPTCHVTAAQMAEIMGRAGAGDTS